MDKRLRETNLGDAQSAESVSYSDDSMWFMPDEMLVEIFKNLNARDRVVLSDTCTRFTYVLSHSRELWRDLDFSKDGNLTTVLDIKRYFDPKSAYINNILRVNVQNVNCLAPKYMLHKYISIAPNLVDINIHGMKFTSIKDLTSFLVPLIHVRRLSIDWPPETTLAKAATCRTDLSEPFGRLVYLSVKMTTFSQTFMFLVRLCQELEELHMFATKENETLRNIEQVDYQEEQEQEVEHFPQGRGVRAERIQDHWDNEDDHDRDEDDEDPLRFHARPDLGGEVQLHLWNAVPDKLASLKLVEYCGDSAREIKRDFSYLLVDGEQWTDFQVAQHSRVNGFYLEKNVGIHRELLKSGCRQSIHGIKKTRVLFFDQLLEAVIETLFENDPVNLSCLANFKLSQQCVLQIEDAKLLLKDPLHQISYLRFNHSIHQESDTYFVGLAFTHLTELVLSNITKSMGNPTHEYKLRSVSKQQTQPKKVQHSCFQMLVVNTPFVKHVTLDAWISELNSGETWDPDALYFIAGWKRLMTLRLYNIPVREDARFLIAVGKRCTFLEVLELHNLGPRYMCYYKPELLLMLPHCRNLREFSMSAPNIVQVHEVVTALSKNPELQKVRLRSQGIRNTSTNLIQSVGQLLSCCPKLTTLYCVIDCISKADSDDLSSYLTRWKDQSDRKHFQFQVMIPESAQDAKEVQTVSEDSAVISFPCKPHYYWSFR